MSTHTWSWEDNLWESALHQACQSLGVKPRSSSDFSNEPSHQPSSTWKAFLGSHLVWHPTAGHQGVLTSFSTLGEETPPGAQAGKTTLLSWPWWNFEALNCCSPKNSNESRLTGTIQNELLEISSIKQMDVTPSWLFLQVKTFWERSQSTIFQGKVKEVGASGGLGKESKEKEHENQRERRQRWKERCQYSPIRASNGQIQKKVQHNWGA